MVIAVWVLSQDSEAGRGHVRAVEEADEMGRRVDNEFGTSFCSLGALPVAIY